jgi:hypothetical protein
MGLKCQSKSAHNELFRVDLRICRVCVLKPKGVVEEIFGFQRDQAEATGQTVAEGCIQDPEAAV